MKISLLKKHKIFGVAMMVPFIVLLLNGCSENSPTSDNLGSEGYGEFWNPQPGDEIIPGQEVPLLDPGYWQDENGQQINPSNRGASRRIGSSGGSVYLDHHYYVIPAGAVSQPTTFTMSYASNSGVAVDCGPSPFQFNGQVTVILSYHNTQYDDDDFDPSGLRIFYMTLDNEYIEMPSIVDEEEEEVRATTDHFSRYILG